jgi:hypothetical protein
MITDPPRQRYEEYAQRLRRWTGLPSVENKLCTRDVRSARVPVSVLDAFVSHRPETGTTP